MAITDVEVAEVHADAVQGVVLNILRPKMDKMLCGQTVMKGCKAPQLFHVRRRSIYI